jgi:polyadenylate-binding protein
VKFHRNEAAERALKADKSFKAQKLLVNWVISFNDQAIEANLFTKNLKPTVTERQLLAAYGTIADVSSVQILQEKRADRNNSQKACIYLLSSEEGKKAIDLALKTPEILALYINSTVYISPFLKTQDRLEFV